jgi:hypothetical protein
LITNHGPALPLEEAFCFWLGLNVVCIRLPRPNVYLLVRLIGWLSTLGLAAGCFSITWVFPSSLSHFLLTFINLIIFLGNKSLTKRKRRKNPSCNKKETIQEPNTAWQGLLLTFFGVCQAGSGFIFLWFPFPFLSIFPFFLFQPLPVSDFHY